MPSLPFVALALSAATMLSACVSMSPSDSKELAGFNPLSADPATTSFVADLPGFLQLRDGDVEVRLAAADGSFDERFALTIREPAGFAAGHKGAAGGRRLLTATVRRADLARFRFAQERARKLRDRHVKGMLSVSITGGCRTAQPAADPQVANLFIQSSADRLSLARIDLRATARGALLKRLRACGEG